MVSTITRLRIPTLAVADIELPAEVAKLYDLAYNLWWTWNPAARRLFGDVDLQAWERYRNPVQLLINVEPSCWELLVDSDDFMTAYREVVGEFEAYLAGDGESWFRRRRPDYAAGPIAYFSMEYGLHQSLPIYSGGLGVLSGDHTKSASDLGLPFVAVGLLYRRGYFQQTIDADGLQQHTYVEHDFSRLPLRPAAGRTGREIRVSVPLPGREVWARVWVAEVGRVPLLLLDTDVAGNDPADRPITGTLYVGGREMRLVQELVLGVGGVRALRALDIEPGAWHLNEGHCALLQLERLREKVAGEGLAVDEALGRIARDAVFTTHTPVPAGNEQFERPLVAKYLGPWSAETGVDVERLFALAEAGEAGDGEGFNLTALGLRTSRVATAVSRKNAEVTGAMWGDLLPDRGEQPLVPITNGVHTATWVGREMRRLFERWLGPRWQELLLEEEAWQRVLELPDEALWQAREAQKERLIRFARSRVREQFARHGRSPDELRAVAGLLDPAALTIGFARRFATYKRASLLLADLDRLRRLLAAAEPPLQVLYAGKAHPADRPGQELIQQIFALSQSPDFAGRVVFLENYDMRIARRLVQGVDVWLNTPRRPLEASGTSGQKAALNGALNLSILDGWWPEAYDGDNGWAINGPVAGGDDEQDRADAEALYSLLEEEVIPAYHDRDEGGLPRAWLARVKRSIATVTPRFSSSRMVAEYAERAYLPAAEVTP
jgi:glycogen phosphorylase